MLRLIIAILAINCMLFMTACSSGPSNIEVEVAMKARINEMDSNNEFMPRVDSARNIRCNAISAESAYICDVEVEMIVPNQGHTMKTGQLKMVKLNDVWTYDKNQVVTIE